MKKLLLPALLFASVNLTGQTTDKGTIKVTVTGLRNNKGQVGIRLFNQPNGFPMDGEKATKEIFASPANREATFEIPQWPFGTWAIGTIHDENSNGQFDSNFLGIPKEGFGASNNPKIRFSAPSFQQASFKFDQPNLSLKIIMVYF